MTDPLPAGAQDARARPAPPVGRRFRKGQSGNPKGGPKRPEPRTADIEWLFSQSFTVVIDGEEQHLPLARALLLAMAHRALKGDGKAATELLALHGKAEETRAEQAAARSKKALEAQARREARDREAADVLPPPPVFYDCCSPDQVMEQMGAWRRLPNGLWQITRAAFEALKAMDPGAIDRMDPYIRSTFFTVVEGGKDGEDTG